MSGYHGYQVTMVTVLSPCLVTTTIKPSLNCWIRQKRSVTSLWGRELVNDNTARGGFIVLLRHLTPFLRRFTPFYFYFDFSFIYSVFICLPVGIFMRSLCGPSRRCPCSGTQQHNHHPQWRPHGLQYLYLAGRGVTFEESMDFEWVKCIRIGYTLRGQYSWISVHRKDRKITQNEKGPGNYFFDRVFNIYLSHRLRISPCVNLRLTC